MVGECTAQSGMESKLRVQLIRARTSARQPYLSKYLRRNRHKASAEDLENTCIVRERIIF